MKKLLSVLILLCIGSCEVSAQYTYFEDIIGGEGVFSEGYTNLEVDESGIIVFGPDGSAEIDLNIRRYGFDGSILEEDTLRKSMQGNCGTEGSHTLTTLNNGSGYMSSGYCGYGSQDLECYLLRISENLDTLWNKWYVFEDKLTIFTNIMARDSTIVVSAFESTIGYTGAYENTRIIEIDFDGNILWDKVVHPLTPGVGYRNRGMIEVDDGYYLSGFKRIGLPTPQINPFKAMITKVNYSGDIEWEIYGEDPEDGCCDTPAIVANMSNGDVVAAYTQDYEPYYVDPGFYNFYYQKLKLFKVDDNGTSGSFTWEHDFFTNHEMVNSRVYKIIEAHDGGIIVLGVSAPLISVDYAYSSIPWVLKLNANGDQEWFQTYPHLAPVDYFMIDQRLYDIEKTPDGGYALAGFFHNWELYEEEGAGVYSWLLKIDGCGDVEWDGCEPLGVSEDLLSPIHIAVWPNPATDYVSISLLKNYSQVVLSSAQGKVLLTQDVNYTNQSIRELKLDISQYIIGLYFITVLDDGGNVLSTGKFVLE